MRIGIIGPESSCQIIEKYIRQLDPEVEVKSYPKERVNACASVTETCMEECDAILFSGCAVESFVTEEIEVRKPYTSVEKSVISVAGAFVEMQKKGMELDAFSIDVVENHLIEDLLEAFHILARNITPAPSSPGWTRKSISGGTAGFRGRARPRWPSPHLRGCTPSSEKKG